MERPELLGTNLFYLTDKIALVTGARRDVGWTVAFALAAAGADIVASARTALEVEALSTEVRALGRRAEAVVTDVTVEASCEHLIATIVELLCGLDIPVNNAGINIRKPALELSLAEFQRVLDTNPTRSIIEDMFTIAPPCLRMCGISYFRYNHKLLTLTRMMRSHNFSVHSVVVASAPIPAMFAT